MSVVMRLPPHLLAITLTSLRSVRVLGLLGIVLGVLHLVWSRDVRDRGMRFI